MQAQERRGHPSFLSKATDLGNFFLVWQRRRGDRRRSRRVGFIAFYPSSRVDQCYRHGLCPRHGNEWQSSRETAFLARGRGHCANGSPEPKHCHLADSGLDTARVRGRGGLYPRLPLWARRRDRKGRRWAIGGDKLH
jgi:hypothetical protein